MKKDYLVKLLNGIGTFIVVVVIILAIPLTVPKVFGFELYGILSESMEPAIDTGSIVYVRDVAAEDIVSGDIITYKMDAKSETVATHRVVSVDKDKRCFVTKGDNNESVDASPVSFDRLLGRTEFSIPFLGSLFLFIHSMNGIALIVIMFSVSIICWVFADFLKNKK